MPLTVWKVYIICLKFARIYKNCIFFKLYILLHADDTVILAESKEELQTALNAMYRFCSLLYLYFTTENVSIIMCLLITGGLIEFTRPSQI